MPQFVTYAVCRLQVREGGARPDRSFLCALRLSFALLEISVASMQHAGQQQHHQQPQQQPDQHQQVTFFLSFSISTLVFAAQQFRLVVPNGTQVMSIGANPGEEKRQ